MMFSLFIVIQYRSSIYILCSSLIFLTTINTNSLYLIYQKPKQDEGNDTCYTYRVKKIFFIVAS